MRLDRFDSLEDLNKGLPKLEALGRKIMDIKIFSFTQVKEDGYPMQVPVFYVMHDKGLIKV